MANLKEVKKLAQAVSALSDLIEQARQAIDTKTEWYDEKSEKWQGSDKGEEWSAYLEAAEALVSACEELDTDSVLEN